MKKIFFIAAAAMLLLSMTSCNKDQDGVYNPKQKISKIYESSNWTYNDGDTYNTPRHLSEQWEWDGKMLTSRTLFFESGSISSTYTYTYEDKRISRMDYSDLTQNVQGYLTFAYDGKELVSADLYEGWNGRLDHLCTYRFTHTDGKITAIDAAYVDKGSHGNLNSSMILDVVLPLDFQAKNIVTYKKAKDVSNVYRYELTWTGNNVSQIRMTAGEYGGTIAYTYDDKKNPFYASWRSTWLVEEDYVGVDIIQKNNPLTVTYNSTDYEQSNATYTYTYKNDYPETCTENRKRSISGDPDNGYTGTARYEYEYLK